MDLTTAVNKYRKVVFHVALGYVKSVHDADDIAQNVFLKFCDKSDTLLTEEAAKAWLIRVAINESKNHLKSAWLKRRSDLDESMIMPEDDSLGVIEYVKRLKPKYRTVIYLYYYERYSANDIARLLKMPPSTVSTHLQRAREQLKEIIIKEENYNGKQARSII